MGMGVIKWDGSGLVGTRMTLEVRGKDGCRKVGERCVCVGCVLGVV